MEKEHKKKKLEKNHAELLDEGDRYLFVRPLIIEKTCLACHGCKEEMGEALAKEINRQYPSDRAVGYAKGQIRGAVVVTIPKSIL